MRSLAVLLACTPLAVLEIGLRLLAEDPAGQGVDYDPVVDLHQLKPLFELDQQTGSYEIPASRYNFFRPASFPAQKAAGAKRIFVLGGSTVQGRPYATETAFSTWLLLRLQAADPDSEFQVINCGGVSYASYRVARILEEVLRYQPDAIVLYTGHNEFLEDRSYAQVREFGPVRSLISRIGAKLHTVRWLRQSLMQRQPTKLPSEVDARLDHAGGLDSYQRNEPWRRGVESHFRWTLDRMCQAADRVGVPLILCVPVGDLVQTPPFKTQTDPSLTAARLSEFNQAWQQACDAQRTPQQRLAASKQCLAIDAGHAGAHFLAGRILYQQGDNAGAKVHLSAARDLDVCPLRATGKIVDAVTAAAKQHNLRSVDTPQLLDQRNLQGQRIADGVADPELLVDHVHPTIAGHQMIAAALADQLQELGWIKLSDQAAARYDQLATEHLQSLGEAYYVRGKQRLRGLQKWAAGRAGEFGFKTDDSQ